LKTLNEQEIKNPKEQNHIMAQSSVDPLFLISKYGKIVFVNDTLCQMLGYEPAEINNKSFIN